MEKRHSEASHIREKYFNRYLTVTSSILALHPEVDILQLQLMRFYVRNQFNIISFFCKQWLNDKKLELIVN